MFYYSLKTKGQSVFSPRTFNGEMDCCPFFDLFDFLVEKNLGILFNPVSRLVTGDLTSLVVLFCLLVLNGLVSEYSTFKTPLVTTPSFWS